MLIHFSILGVILITCLVFEKNNKNYALSRVARNEPFKTQFLPWLLIFGYIAFLAAMRTNSNDSTVYISSFNNLEASWQAFWNRISTAEEGKDWAFGAVGILFKMFILKSSKFLFINKFEFLADFIMCSLSFASLKRIEKSF